MRTNACVCHDLAAIHFQQFLFTLLRSSGLIFFGHICCIPHFDVSGSTGQGLAGVRNGGRNGFNRMHDGSCSHSSVISTTVPFFLYHLRMSLVTLSRANCRLSRLWLTLYPPNIRHPQRQPRHEPSTFRGLIDKLILLPFPGSSFAMRHRHFGSVVDTLHRRMWDGAAVQTHAKDEMSSKC